MNKTRLPILFALMFAGLLLAACDIAVPAGAEIQVADDGQSAQVEFTGTVDSIAVDQWVIQGYNVLVDAQTVIDGSFVAGDVVHVYAIVDINGVVTASRIEGYSPASIPSPESGDGISGISASDDAEFVGVVESIAADQWIVSGQVVLITSQTEIKDTIVAGDTVKVHTYLDENNALTAREIELALVSGSMDQISMSAAELELTGVVEAIAPDLWTVSGQEFFVNAQTEIKDIIAIGDRVKVHLLVGTDNSLTAREIELADEDDSPTAYGMLEITGSLEAINGDLWTIGGKVFLVTPQTEIKSAPVVGDLVKAEAIINPDGSLTATEIKNVVMDTSSDDDDSSGSGGNSGSDSSDDHSGDDDSSDGDSPDDADD
ncbi:MAG: hypothetical protein HY781_09080 [Chloroflexi bacterium]|nr:hypothetical protein [Chloroflexota bacterium]